MLTTFWVTVFVILSAFGLAFFSMAFVIERIFRTITRQLFGE